MFFHRDPAGLAGRGLAGFLHGFPRSGAAHQSQNCDRNDWSVHASPPQEGRRSGIAAAPPAGCQSLSFFISSLWWLLPFSMPMSLACPAEEPAAPTVEPLLPPPADEPPVPTVDAELEPEPAAEPPVPTLDELLPPPADEPPVPSVEAEPEPLPEPAAEPPVPIDELLVPPPADEPPVPSVEAEPEPLPEPADEPPVPTVELLVPPPADDPPVPTVELDCATASAVPASSAAAAADNFRILIAVSSNDQIAKTGTG